MRRLRDRTCLFSILVLSGTVAFAQGSGKSHPDTQAAPTIQTSWSPRDWRAPDELRQELDAYALALSKVPADPLVQPDPFSPVFKPIDRLVEKANRAQKLKFGATYTFLNQYALSTPGGVRHDQLSGRLDLTAAWVAYEHDGSGGSISMLVRSGANIGTSQQFNLSDRLGSGLYLNCLQGGGAQQPITLNILYWRQDFLKKRLSFYVGKIHPNEYISLSMFNNDERAQFLNGGNDGDLAVASEGTYAGGGAVEFQADRHVYIHAIAVDTEGAAQRNLKSLVDRKYMEAVEVGWFSGLPGQKFQDYRVAFWRDDTKNAGSGYGGGIAFEYEFSNGWAPFGRYALATHTGAAIRQIQSIGLAQVHPFGRRGDMFGIAFNHSEPNQTGKHHESVFESFYRLRLTQSVEIGPDIEVSVHPTYSAKSYTRTLVGARMRILF